MPSYQIDADTTARVAKVPVGTLNVWIQRRLLPGVEVGPRGRPRTFSLDDVMHIAIMAALVRAGISSPLASEAAAFARPRWHEPNAILVIGPSEDPRLRGGGYEYYVLSGDALKPEHFLSAWNVKPEGYVVVELARIAIRVKAFLEAEERAKADSQHDRQAGDDEAA